MIVSDVVTASKCQKKVAILSLLSFNKMETEKVARKRGSGVLSFSILFKAAIDPFTETSFSITVTC